MFLFVLGSHPFVNIIHCLKKWSNSEVADDCGSGGDGDGDGDGDDDDGDDGDDVTGLATRFWATGTEQNILSYFQIQKHWSPEISW